MILLDVRLGDRSGLEVFRDLHQLDPKSLIIFITRTRHDRHRDRGHEAGGLRLPGQAVGRRPTSAGGASGAGHQPPDARAG